MNDYRYFEITGGYVALAIAMYRTLVADADDLLREIQQEFGAYAGWSNGHHLIGLQWADGVIPEGWRRVRGTCDACVPAGNNPKARALRARLAKVPHIGSSDFHDLITGSGFGFTGGHGERGGIRLRRMGYSIIGGHAILHVPAGKECHEGMRWKAPDSFCKEIKCSEYWRLKERYED